MKKSVFKIFQLNRSGFSVMEALIGIFLVGLISVFSVGTISAVRKGGLLAESRSGLNSTNQILQSYLSSINICTYSVDRVTLIPIAPNSTDPTNPDPGAFDLRFNIKGLGGVQANAENDLLGLYFDRVFLDEGQFAEKNDLGMHRYIGLLKVSGSQRIIDQVATEAGGGVLVYKRGVQFKEQTVGAITVTLSDQNQIIDCTMGPRTLTEPPPTGCVTGCSDDPVVINDDWGYECLGPGCGPSDCVAAGSCPPPAACTSLQQCAVYDFYIRNGIPNALSAANAWMTSNPNWSAIADSYLGQLTAINQMNLISNVYGTGLVQTGLNGADTIDAWVSRAVANDPTGIAMLRTQSGMETFASMFPATPGDIVVAGTLFTTTSQEALKDILSTSPEVTMNSAFGADVWTQALGLVSTNQFVTDYTAAAVNAAANPLALRDPAQLAAMDVVRAYIATNTADGIAIARGTGLWANNVPGGAAAVIGFISGSFADTGSMATSMNLARATDQWAENYSGGAVSVADFIRDNAAIAADIVSGTVIANDVFGGSAVAQRIMEDPSGAAQIAQDLATFQQQSNWDTVDMQNYVRDNPTTWEADLANAVRPP